MKVSGQVTVDLTAVGYGGVEIDIPVPAGRAIRVNQCKTWSGFNGATDLSALAAYISSVEVAAVSSLGSLIVDAGTVMVMPINRDVDKTGSPLFTPTQDVDMVFVGDNDYVMPRFYVNITGNSGALLGTVVMSFVIDYDEVKITNDISQKLLAASL